MNLASYNDCYLLQPDVKSSSPRPQTLSTTDVQRTRQDNASPVPNAGSPRHSSKELLAYKVLGTIGKVLLVLDTRSNETHAMKVFEMQFSHYVPVLLVGK